MRFLIEKQKKRKMQTLNLIGIWKRQQPVYTICTSNGAQRWSIHFIFAFSFCLRFLPVASFDFFNSLFNRYRYRNLDLLHRPVWDSKRMQAVFVASRLVKPNDNQSMGLIDQFNCMEFRKRFNTHFSTFMYCGNILICNRKINGMADFFWPETQWNSLFTLFNGSIWLRHSKLTRGILTSCCLKVILSLTFTGLHFVWRHIIVIRQINVIW